MEEEKQNSYNSLVSDLKLVLKDTIYRYEYFKKLADGVITLDELNENDYSDDLILNP
jgi:uncharacterized hydantoinase/oxoprolinase family protein